MVVFNLSLGIFVNDRELSLSLVIGMLMIGTNVERGNDTKTQFDIRHKRHFATFFGNFG